MSCCTVVSSSARSRTLRSVDCNEHFRDSFVSDASQSNGRYLGLGELVCVVGVHVAVAGEDVDGSRGALTILQHIIHVPYALLQLKNSQPIKRAHE